MILFQNKGKIFEQLYSVEITIPLNSKNHKEISFLLKKEERSNKERIDELCNIINDLYEEKLQQKKEIDELKKKLEEFMNHEIHIIGLDGNKNGSKIEVQLIEEKKFKDIMNMDIKKYYFYLKLLIKYDKNKKNRAKVFFDYNNIPEGCNISFPYDDVICLVISWYIPLDEEAKKDKIMEMVKNLLNIKKLLDININFCTDVLIKDILESKEAKELYEKLLKFNMIIKGLTLNNKLWIKSLLNQLEKSLKIKDSTLPRIFFYLENSLHNKKTLFYFLKSIQDEIIILLEKFELFKQIKSSVTFLLNSFKGFKHLKLADCLNFEDFEFYILIAGLEKGLYFKFCLPSLNEVLKKEIFEKIKIDEK